MKDEFIPREWVADQLQVTLRTLARYERAGIVQSTLRGRERVYRRTELRRISTAVNLERDLGVNLAGVEVILQMRERMLAMMHQMNEVAQWAEQVAQPAARPRRRSR